MVFGGIRAGAGAFLPPPIALPGALIAPGLVLAAMMTLRGWHHVGQRPVDTYDAIIRSTVEQAVLALLIWPFVAVTLGGTVVLYMGFAFALSRLIYWYGVLKSPVAETFAAVATFSATLLSGVWTLLVWV